MMRRVRRKEKKNLYLLLTYNSVVV
jgi:hypothetical protein